MLTLLRLRTRGTMFGDWERRAKDPSWNSRLLRSAPPEEFRGAAGAAGAKCRDPTWLADLPSAKMMRPLMQQTFFFYPASAQLTVQRALVDSA